MTPSPTVTLDDVSVSFRTRHALRGVTLEMERGVTGIVGPNGAGKTTLLRILATVLAVSRGDVRICGLDPSRADDRILVRRRLGYVPQEPGAIEHFTAFEYVDYFAILKEWNDAAARHDEVRRVLAAVGLADDRHRKVRDLSGGMRRRVVIAQALLGDPTLVLMDEPMTGLDPAQRLRLRDVVTRLAERSTVVVSTHHTSDVEAMCRRVVVLDEGTVRFVGTPAALAASADGRVWWAERRDPTALVAWGAGDGRIRNVGDPPEGAELCAPTVEDAYLLLVGPSSVDASPVVR